jgi:hypothetical protein
MTARLAALAVLLSPAAVRADEPLRFVWQVGATHAYHVSHVTTVTETLRDEKTGKPTTTTAVTKMTLSRRWEVKAVDAAGTGTVELVITALKQEHSKPDGLTVVVDSATVDGAKEMAEYLNKPILTAKIDARGRVAEVTPQAGGDAAASRLRAELPFRLELPDAAPAVNAAWERAFAVRLDPPLGTGESYDATQGYTYKGRNGDYAVVGVSTALKNPPTAAADLQPLVSWLWAGDVFFDAKAGRYHAAKLSATKEIVNHQGAGTKFVYQSEYVESATK